MTEEQKGEAFALVIDCSHPLATRHWIGLVESLQDPKVAQKGTSPAQVAAGELALAACAGSAGPTLLGEGLSFDTNVPPPTQGEVEAIAKARNQTGSEVRAAPANDTDEAANAGSPPVGPLVPSWDAQSAARQLQMSAAAFALADAALASQDYAIYDCAMRALRMINPTAYAHTRALSGMNDASYELYRQFPGLRGQMSPAPARPEDELRGGLTGIVYKPKAKLSSELAYNTSEQIGIGGLGVAAGALGLEVRKQSNEAAAQEAAAQEKVRMGNVASGMEAMRDNAVAHLNNAPSGSAREAEMKRALEKLERLRQDASHGLVNSEQAGKRMAEIGMIINTAPPAPEKGDTEAGASKSGADKTDAKAGDAKADAAKSKGGGNASKDPTTVESDTHVIEQAKKHGGGAGRGAGGGEAIEPGFEPPVLVLGDDFSEKPEYFEPIGPDLELAVIEQLEFAQELLMQMVLDELAKFDFVEDHPDAPLDEEFFGMPYIMKQLGNCYLSDPMEPIA